MIKWDGFDANFVGGGVFVEFVVVVCYVDEMGVFVDEVVLEGDDFGRGVPMDFVPGALIGDVAQDEIAFGGDAVFGLVISGYFVEFGVIIAVGWFEWVKGFKAGFQGGVDQVVPLGVFVEATSVNV